MRVALSIRPQAHFSNDSQMTHYYRVHELTIASELDLGLPEMPPSAAAPDVVIECAPVPAEPPPTSTRVAAFAAAGIGDFWLEVPTLARYRVLQGRQIIVDARPNADPAGVRLFLLGSCFGAMLHQRGTLVLHGCAVKVGDACLVVAGHTGAGKSTVAAAFLQRGHPVLADDVVAVDAAGDALPGLPRIKLWKDAADQLGIATERLQRIRPSMPKFDVPLGKRHWTSALPIRWVYILATHPEPDYRIDVLAGRASFQPLYNETYRPRYVKPFGVLESHMRRCSQLAAQAQVARIYRPAMTSRPAELAQRLLDSIAVAGKSA